ncbi:6-phosphofructokinase [Streptomyces goshikiensis]|uniref:ATP-dependent 6-phosphofructokinase n=1 Tax=Streptomyces goshikiensis TaxID=1942 RepID=A0ABZ1RGQ0_9ACTN|nr:MULTISPECIES: 6-phosphofructokinase [Streptomyces]AKL68748.1 6-phosphofructokinase [Streptomyces sp. Mg1]EDX24148.1 6-phosphofructokinase 3 [Streptomyces sp. Mg1]MBP0937320.1 6-phosphofructokinase [Streptomyces sp. KCTC 0041BP]OKI39675.1 6-phosphofructokinase [Streptomyces sp. CB03578]PJN20443.1 6-phosphofructokinase [Streptomyces sp. CB02120-2]
MRIGVLTSGGDCPGLNAVIRSVVHRAVVDHGDEVIGFHDGWRGLLECDYRKLDLDAVNGILARGGTILGSSRVQPAHLRDGVERARGHVADLGLDAIIPIGGEGTLKAANLLSQGGLPIVGVPKTIDNDIASTDVTFGFDTAVGVATEALDRLKTTAESHQRVMVVEVMGRHTGWIALHSGMAAGAHAIVVPERPFDIERLTEIVGERFSAGKRFAIVVVAEGAKPALGSSMAVEAGGTDMYGHERFAGIGNRLAVELEDRLGKEARPVILGHVQRGGTPTAYDRVLATRFGWHAVEAAHRGEFGMLTALRGTDIVMVPLADAVQTLKTVPAERYDEAETVL